MSSVIDENTQFIDPATSTPINNGYIYIGTVGLDAKLNPITIYSDRDLTTVLANPQRTGPDGRALNKIWVPGKYSMKVENYENVQKLNDLDLGEFPQTGNTVLTNVQGINTLTAEASPAITALIDKQVYILTAVSTNTGGMTLTIDSTPTYPINKNHDQPLVAGDVEANQNVAVIYNSTDNVFELFTDSAIPSVDILSNQTIAGDKTFTGAFTSPGIDDNATATAMTIASSGEVTIATPTAGNALVVNGLANNNTGSFVGSSIAGQSYGLIISAGTNSTDYNMFWRDVTGATTFLQISGAGGGATGGLAPPTTNGVWNFVGLEINGITVPSSIAFSVWKSGDQTNITGEATITWDTEDFDTNSNFASNAFTPTIAGRYLIAAHIEWDACTVGDPLFIHIKNGAGFVASTRMLAESVNSNSMSISMVVDANGTTDSYTITAENTARNTSTVSGVVTPFTRFYGYRV